MVTLVAQMAGAPAEHPRTVGPAVRTAARTGQASALPVLEKIIWHNRDWTIREHGVRALGQVDHARTLRLLQPLYDQLDGNVPDSTLILDEDGRARLADVLHRTVRGLEPVIVEELKGGNAASADLAFRLLGRAAAHGPMAQPQLLMQALKDYAVHDRRRDQEAIRALVERLRS